jgi:3-keto-5-aminohexanoate cleavage enzyme
MSSTSFKASEKPLVIETAISVVVANAGGKEPTTENLVNEAKACIAAGAGIIHCHHDFALSRADSIAQCIAINQGVLAAHPGTLMYPGFLPGTHFEERMGHLEPMYEAGVLSRYAFDPGLSIHGRLDENRLMTKSVSNGATFEQASAMIERGQRYHAPASLGIFEPGALRWVRSFGSAGKFVPGTLVKIYFPGNNAWGATGSTATYGLPASKVALDLYLSLLEGSNTPWIVSVLGDSILETDLPRYILERGGHLRVGVEDPLRKTEMSNVEMVEAVIELASKVGRPVARSTEALAALSAR